MNKENIEQENIIERYLLHQLEADEAQAFQLYLLEHPELQIELAKMRITLRAIRSQKSSLPLTSTQYKKWGGAIIGIFIFTIFIGFLFQYNRTKKLKSSSPLQNSMPEQHINLPIIPSPSVDTSTSLPIQEVSPPILKDKLSQPMAGLDLDNFRQNPDLEKYVGTSFRTSTNYQLTVSDTFTLDANETIILRLSGNLEVSPNQNIPELWLRIFDNQPQNYLQFRPFLNEKIILKKTNTGYEHSFLAKLQINPGRYYILIEDDKTGEYVTVVPIVIKK
jgi:hypothetical protein